MCHTGHALSSMYYSHGGLPIESSIYHHRSRDRYHLRRTGFALCCYIHSRVIPLRRSGQASATTYIRSYMSNLLSPVVFFGGGGFWAFLVVYPAFLGGVSERSIPYTLGVGYLSVWSRHHRICCGSMPREAEHNICWAGWAAALLAFGGDGSLRVVVCMRVCM